MEPNCEQIPNAKKDQPDSNICTAVPFCVCVALCVTDKLCHHDTVVLYIAKGRPA